MIKALATLPLCWSKILESLRIYSDGGLPVQVAVSVFSSVDASLLPQGFEYR